MLWPIPGCCHYAVDIDGTIYNLQTQKPLKPFFKDKYKRRLQIHLYNGQKRRTALLARAVLSAKLGRTLEPWEEARHIDGNPLNNTMDNLSAGDHLNNVIDCIEEGNRKTSYHYIKQAIERLQMLL